MTTRLTLAIQEHHGRLSPSERQLAELLLDHADDLLTYSATELASMAGVSKATAARLFRSLGYADFNEVRLQAREERNLAPPVLDRPPPRTAAPRPHSIAAHLQAEADALARTFESLRSDTLQAAADRVATAPRVWLLGLGADEGLVRLVRPALARVRPEVQLLGTQNGVWSEDLAMMRPRDVLLLVLTQPRTRVIERLATHAATTRLDTVAVVDLRNAAWARRACSVVLPCHGNGQDQGLVAAASQGRSTGDGDAAATAASMLMLLVRRATARLGTAARRRQEVVAQIQQELDGD